MGEIIINPSTDNNGGVQDGTTILNDDRIYCG